MALSVSTRSENIAQSEIRNMSIESDRVNAINLSQGICDLDLPEPVKSGAIEAMVSGINHYTRYDGLGELRGAISRKLLDYNRIPTDPEKNVVVSCGATGALYSAFLALLNPGDEVIIFEPFYGYHVSTIIAANCVPVYVRLSPPDWIFRIEDLDAILTPRTKGIMVNTPANPCGKVFTMEELHILADFAIKHDIFVFTDEIYEYFVYDGLEHISPGSINEIADRTITISGYSKTFSITGWRIGYAACHEKWAKMVGYISDLIYVCAPAPLQIGVARGVNLLPKDYYSKLCDTYKDKREQICSVLKDKGLEPYIPQGAYYVLANVSDLPGKNSKERAMYLLRTTGVATVPGGAFYHDDSGESYVRFCFAKDSTMLDEACKRLRKM
jgi:aminotransferase